MHQLKRREYIISQLNLKGEVFVLQLAEQLNVTAETIRRDLSVLEENNLITKIHGGAIKHQSTYEQKFNDRLQNHKNEKMIIAKNAVKLLKENDTIFIDSGTTTLYFAENIPSFRLIILTNSTAISNVIWERNSNAEIHLLGGRFNGELRANFGTKTILEMSGLYADYAFIGAGAIDDHLGIMVKNIDEGNIAKKMLEQSRKKIILTDSSKFFKNGLMKIIDLDCIDLMFTDDELPINKRLINKNIIYCK